MVLSMKLSGTTNCPLPIDSVNDPHAVDANMWVHPASRNASILAR